VERPAFGWRLAAHRHIGRLEAEAAGGRHGGHRDVAAACAQGVEDQLAIALELARRRRVAEHVRPDQPKRAW
jgi:hypothetical protein